MKTIVITFGRFQGIHRGHEMLANFMRTKAEEVDGTYMMFPTYTHDKKNPIPFETKVKHLKALLPSHSEHISTNHPTSIVGILKMLSSVYERVIFVCGSDRIVGFEKWLHNYNGLEYHFEQLDIIAAGNPRSEHSEYAVEGCSGTNMRLYVTVDNYYNFALCSPTEAPEDIIPEVYNELRQVMLTTICS